MIQMLLSSLLQRNLNNRSVAIWGVGKTSSRLAGDIFGICPVAVFIDSEAQCGDTFLGRPVISSNNIHKEDYFVIVLAGTHFVDIRTALTSNGFVEFDDWFDYCYENYALNMPYDWECNGVLIGAHSTFGILNRNNFNTPGLVKSIGRYTHINEWAYIETNHQVSISSSPVAYGMRIEEAIEKGHYCIPDSRNTGHRVTIGNDVWIGAYAFINASSVAEIGDGAIIGAGAIVTHDVPPYAIVYGNPAQIQRYRFTPEQIEVLLRVQWWAWDRQQLRENAELLAHPEKFFKKYA